jgi:hypothetical protein
MAGVGNRSKVLAPKSKKHLALCRTGAGMTLTTEDVSISNKSPSCMDKNTHFDNFFSK